MLTLDFLPLFQQVAADTIAPGGIASAEAFGTASLTTFNLPGHPGGKGTLIAGSNVARRVFGSRTPNVKGSGWSGVR